MCIELHDNISGILVFFLSCPYSGQRTPFVMNFANKYVMFSCSSQLNIT